MTPIQLNLISLAATFVLVGSYHLYLRFKLRHNPSYTIQAINLKARESWVRKIMSGQEAGILAVQTLRNSTMAATFLASTSILLIIGVLNLVQKDESISNMLLSLHGGVSNSDILWGIKLLPLCVIFFSAFFCFSLAVRMYNHVGYLINSSDGKTFCPSPAYVARLLNRSGHYYSLGMRAYYLSVPMVFWLFGPYLMLAASVGLVVVLYHVDRAPDSDESHATDAEYAKAEHQEKQSVSLVNRIAEGE